MTTPVAEMVAALNAFRPQALTAYATVAAALAGELVAPGAVPPPIEVTPVSGIERDPATAPSSS